LEPGGVAARRDLIRFGKLLYFCATPHTRRFFPMHRRACRRGGA